MAALLSDDDRAFATVVSKLGYCNPFLPERIELEREALGDAFVPGDAVWSKRDDLAQDEPNVTGILLRLDPLLERLREKIAKGARPSGDDRLLYEDLVLFHLFHQRQADFRDAIVGPPQRKTDRGPLPFYRRFLLDWQRFFGRGEAAGQGLSGGSGMAPQLAFAFFFQIRRAFHHIFDYVIGESMPAARLRAAVWQSIFTHNMRRYRRALYHRMADATCLILGPSGTGKELVARAIGLSQFIPFDPKTEKFATDFAAAFYALSISALSPTLIESELFGHRRGAFTGAVQDRAGWLEVCPPLGAVFLDEIAEIDGAIQVKLLRVLQTRAFQRLGETKDRVFHGKLIAATNRDLAGEMRAGRFREDLYYRLCSDVIVTPALRDQLRDSQDALPNLIRHTAQRLAGPEEAEALTREALAWIEAQLGPDYPWPGNVRELEQCVRNVMIHKAYHPVRPVAADAAQDLAEAFRSGALTADELLRRYCGLVYAQTRSYQETARRLGLDRRTVKAKIAALQDGG